MCPHGALSFTAAGAPSTCSLARSLGTCSASPELHLLRGDDRSIRVIQLRLQLLQVCPCSANMSHHRRAPDPENKRKEDERAVGRPPWKSKKANSIRSSKHLPLLPSFDLGATRHVLMSSCPKGGRQDEKSSAPAGGARTPSPVDLGRPSGRRSRLPTR